MTLRVLGIETSCDETAAAVVDETGRVFSDVVRSQIELHLPFGGIVPEIAARDHVTALPAVVSEALQSAGLTVTQLDAVAVTHRPGLAGALLVGVQLAKGLAWGADKPLIGVDHLVGHLLAVFLQRGEEAPVRPEFPFVALLASGGHTALYRVEGTTLGEVQELGATRDDAAGEAFDKVAKLLGLDYPGGPIVDRLAGEGSAEQSPIALDFPGNRLGLEFSFSGMKSAVARFVEQSGRPTGPALANVCAAFQRAVVGSLAKKALAACAQEGVSRLVLGGGVAANRGLRDLLALQAARANVSLFVPSLASCTDNAAMIGYVGALRLARGEHDDFDLAPHTKSSLASVTRKGGGIRSPKRKGS